MHLAKSLEFWWSEEGALANTPPLGLREMDTLEENIAQGEDFKTMAWTPSGRRSRHSHRQGLSAARSSLEVAPTN
jgi:hypothetical protein